MYKQSTYHVKETCLICAAGVGCAGGAAVAAVAGAGAGGGGGGQTIVEVEVIKEVIVYVDKIVEVLS